MHHHFLVGLSRPYQVSREKSRTGSPLEEATAKSDPSRTRPPDKQPVRQDEGEREGGKCLQASKVQHQEKMQDGIKFRERWGLFCGLNESRVVSRFTKRPNLNPVNHILKLGYYLHIRYESGERGTRNGGGYFAAAGVFQLRDSDAVRSRV